MKPLGLISSILFIPQLNIVRAVRRHHGCRAVDGRWARYLIVASAITLALGLISTPSAQNRAGGLSFSGIFESSVSASVADNDAHTLSYGLEEYANIRMQSRVGENATFYGALNLIAAAGDYALRASAMGANVDIGENYTAAIELERLYFRIKTETMNFDGGLMRLPFGFSTVWGPLDFLNPKNPLKPDARPRAVLGGGMSWFPIDDFKVQGFAVTGRDPLANNSGIAGVAADRHWDKLSAQALYAFERSDRFATGYEEPHYWTHRAGLSLKADIVMGVIAEMLYTHNENIDDKLDGLSLSVGFDYSLFDAKLIILAEYLRNGQSSSTSISSGGYFIDDDYFYAGLTWRFSDFTTAGAALITSATGEDALITFGHELFQGVSLAAMAQIPIRRAAQSDDGEIAAAPGSAFYLETKLKFKF